MTVDNGKKNALSIAIPLIAISAFTACGSAPLPPEVPKGPTSTQVFEECRAQEGYGDAASCWKHFLAEYESGTNVPAAELEYARAKSSEGPKRPTCNAGTSWDGSKCKSLCSEDDNGETWDSSAGLCLRRIALQCFRFFHQEDGHCIPDAQCPDGFKRASDGGCEEAPATPFKPGERVVSIVEQQDSSNKLRVKKGAKGTYWDNDGPLAFVIWDTFVGLTPQYPGPEKGVPQGKNQYAYWVGLDEIVKDGASADDTSLIPQWCGQASATPSYGRIRVGTMVKLGKHRPVDGNANWGSDMEPFVGKVGRVTKLPGVDAAGCPVVRTDADREQFAWRIRDMSLAPVSRPTPAGPQTAPPK